MDYALILLIVACIAVGAVAAVVRTWSLHARLYSLEDRVSVNEGITTREVKIRAADSRGKNRPADEALYKELASNPIQPQRKKNFWEVDLPRSAVK